MRRRSGGLLPELSSVATGADESPRLTFSCQPTEPPGFLVMNLHVDNGNSTCGQPPGQTGLLAPKPPFSRLLLRTPQLGSTCRCHGLSASASVATQGAYARNGVNTDCESVHLGLAHPSRLGLTYAGSAPVRSKSDQIPFSQECREMHDREVSEVAREGTRRVPWVEQTARQKISSGETG